MAPLQLDLGIFDHSERIPKLSTVNCQLSIVNCQFGEAAKQQFTFLPIQTNRRVLRLSYRTAATSIPSFRGTERRNPSSHKKTRPPNGEREKA